MNEQLITEVKKIINAMDTLYAQEICIKSQIQFVIFYDLVTSICKEEGDAYIFTTAEENEENRKKIDKWITVIRVLMPFKNIVNFRKVDKKVLSTLKHICVNFFKEQGIKWVSKHVSYPAKKGGQRTKYIHRIEGLKDFAKKY